MLLNNKGPGGVKAVGVYPGCVNAGGVKVPPQRSCGGPGDPGTLGPRDPGALGSGGPGTQGPPNDPGASLMV